MFHAHSIDAFHGGMAHDTEISELDVDFLVCCKYLLQSFQVFYFCLQTKCHLLVALYPRGTIVVGRPHHIAHDDEGLVAEHLSEKVDVLGGV